MLRAVIFDVGGVLADDVWENLLLDKSMGVAAAYHLDTQLVEEIGRTLWEQFAYITSPDWEKMEVDYWTEFSQRSGISAPVGELVALTETFIRPIHGMVDLLKRLKSKGIPVALCSNNTEFWFHRQKTKLDLYRFFSDEQVILSCHIGKAKKSQGFEMFDAAVKSLGFGKQECILVDDRPDNIFHALEYGLAGIIFPARSPQGAKYLTSLFERLNLL